MKDHRGIPCLLAAALCAVAVTVNVRAQEVPSDYQDVLKTLAKQGDFKANVLKVNIPRKDVTVIVDGVATPTPFGFGGWLAMTKGDGGMDVMMGDLVLTEDEVNPVMSALLDNGLDVTALHNHFFYENPRIFYMKSPPRPGTDIGRASARLAARTVDADLEALERQLADILGLRVQVTHKGPGGSVTLSYSSLDQLDMICQRLSG